jgi:hypothetical protein
MNANPLAKHYSLLTPEERFKLILTAGARGDDEEQTRLVNAGGRITQRMPDHTPYARAFDELATLVFIELMDEVARYSDAFHRADATDFDDDEAEAKEGDEAEEESDAKADAEPAKGGTGKRPAGQRFFDLALAAGFVLRTKAEGWKLFCDRLHVPPFVLWGLYPGFDRLQRALALAEKAAFVPEGMVRWLNDIRPAGEPKLTEVPLTVERVADETEEMFRTRVKWWSG